MNSELKAILSMVCDAVRIEKDVEGKLNVVAMLPDLFQAISDIPGVVSSFTDLQNELAALKTPSNQADLVSFIEAKFGEVVSNQKANDILNASLKIVQDGVNDLLALQKVIHE